MRALAYAVRIAETQFGVVTRRQLLAAGVTDAQIKHLVHGGALVVVHPGVYVVVGWVPSIQQRALAACLACGPQAVSSFGTAAALMELCPVPDVNHRRTYVAVTVGEKLGLRPAGRVSPRTSRQRQRRGAGR